jgi:uncharacterized oligopeptide transporter (OPT) family protein
MSTIIKGLLGQNLPWGLLLVGVFITITLELCEIDSLSFAVGVYLPVAVTTPIYAGALVRAWVDWRMGPGAESDAGAGTLFSSGLIAGGSLAGVLYAVLFGRKLVEDAEGVTGLVPFVHEGTSGQIAGLLLFVVLGAILARAATRAER